MLTQTTSSSAPIGIFDSGVGGLSILKAIQQQLPNEDLIYIADSANAPYGDKAVEFIQQRSLQLSEFLLKHHIKALVVACNTATTEAISYLRAQLSLPVVGVEPAIKPAAEQSKNNVIGILATHRTIQSERLQELISLYANQATIIPQACPGLVEAVENNRLDQQQTIYELLQRYTQTMQAKQVDTLILGCTHYPFISNHVREIMGEQVTILETGKPVATQLGKILMENELQNSTLKTGKVTIYSSLEDSQHYQTICKLWESSISIHNLPENLSNSLTETLIKRCS